MTPAVDDPILKQLNATSEDDPILSALNKKSEEPEAIAIPKDYDRLNPKTWKSLQDGANYITADRKGQKVVKKWNEAAQEFQRADDTVIDKANKTGQGIPVSAEDIEKSKGDTAAVDPLKPTKDFGVEVFKNTEAIKFDAANQFEKVKTIAQEPQIQTYMQLLDLWKSTDDPQAKGDISKKLEKLRSEPFQYTELLKPVEGKPKPVIGEQEPLMPELAKAKTVGDAVNYTIDQQEEGRALVGDVARNAKVLKDVSDEVQQLSPKDPRGFWFNFTKATIAHSRAIDSAKKLATSSVTEQMDILENGYIQQALFPEEQPKGLGKVGEIAGETGSTVVPTIAATGVGSLVNPVVGMVAGAAYSAADMAMVQYAQGMQQQYTELRQKGTPKDLAMEQANQYAKASAAVSGAVGATVGVFLPALKGESQVIAEQASSVIAKKFFTDVLKNSAVDFTVGTGQQLTDNYLSEKFGGDRGIFNGTLEQGGMMAIQGSIVGLLTHGFPEMTKYVEAKNREQGIEALAHLTPIELQQLYGNAEQNGSNKQEIENLKDDVAKEINVVNSIPADANSKQQKLLLPLLRNKQDIVLEMEKNKLLPEEHYKGKIAEIDSQMNLILDTEKQDAIQEKLTAGKKLTAGEVKDREAMEEVGIKFKEPVEEKKEETEPAKTETKEEKSDTKEQTPEPTDKHQEFIDLQTQYDKLKGKRGKTLNGLSDFMEEHGEKAEVVKYVNDKYEEIKAKLAGDGHIKINVPCL